MIQRKQSLFLLLSAFAGLILLFIPVIYVTQGAGQTGVALIPPANNLLESTAGHSAAIILNFLGIVLSFVTIFAYNKRAFQVRLTYALIVMWLVIMAMIMLCPFIEGNAATHFSYSAVAVCAGAIICCVLAARSILRDIALLKSVDRIR